MNILEQLEGGYSFDPLSGGEKLAKCPKGEYRSYRDRRGNPRAEPVCVRHRKTSSGKMYKYSPHRWHRSGKTSPNCPKGKHRSKVDHRCHKKGVKVYKKKSPKKTAA